MRCLIVWPAFRGRPYELSIDKGIIAGLLASRYGWDVTIASQCPATAPTGVRCLAYGTGRMASLRCIAEEARRTDVLYLAHLDERNFLRARLYKLLNPHGVCVVRLGAWTHLDRLEALSRWPPYAWLLRLGCRAIDVCHGESSNSLRRFSGFAAAHGLAVETVFVPSCGFDLAEVIPECQEVVPNAAEVLFVGRVGAPVKATDLLLDAFARLREHHGSAATLRVVGPMDGRFAEWYDHWRRRVRPETCAAVSLAGPEWDRRRLLRLYLQAKVFVIASRSEGGPNAFVEAASCGCLLVGTSVGQVADVIRASGSGWEVPVGDRDALADALRAAVATADSREAREGRIRAFGRTYSWACALDALTARCVGLVRARQGTAASLGLEPGPTVTLTSARREDPGP